MKNNLKKLILMGRVAPMYKIDTEKNTLTIIGYRRKSRLSKKAHREYWLDEPIELTLEEQKKIIGERIEMAVKDADSKPS